MDDMDDWWKVLDELGVTKIDDNSPISQTPEDVQFEAEAEATIRLMELAGMVINEETLFQQLMQSIN